MCFYIHVSYSVIKTAEENIVCYKRLSYAFAELSLDRIKELEIRKNTLISPYQHMKYRIRETHTSVLRRDSRNPFAISLGLHSYTNLLAAESNTNSGEVIVKCIIPKGARYYVDPVREHYVSNKLRTVKIVR